MTEIDVRPDLSVERHGAVACVRIDRGTPVNALRPETMCELTSVLDTLESDDTVRAIILGYHGRHFTAGAELSFLESLKSASEDRIRNEIYRHFQNAVKRLYQCPKPTIAAIGGAAVTVGCELALACDFRIVTEHASFQESWIRLGLMAPLGGMKKLPALVGYGLATDMMLRGRAVGGAEAVSAGLAHRLVVPGDLDAEALALGGELAALAPLAYRAIKAGLHHGLENDFETNFAKGLDSQCRLIQSEDFREGVDAVLGKYSPRFRGC
ncbi:MAG: enoyl-CoA hydratase/isomerase family protein [Proteobacteria bacterium]|nr:enoyl-CoA hydratase/isomerase family protein [Pseudomonadota bacterium]HQR03335.1 enoyl-CoA hydratase/isomerase family protein [Rhodocyclaceae bacterium]